MPQTYDLDWHGDEALEVIGEATALGLFMGGEHLLQVSRERAPLEEGDLARSGQSTPLADIDPDDLTVVVSYDRVYAARQHEELTWNHAPGKTAKYLENPAIEERQAIAELIAAPPQAVVNG